MIQIDAAFKQGIDHSNNVHGRHIETHNDDIGAALAVIGHKHFRGFDGFSLKTLVAEAGFQGEDPIGVIRKNQDPMGPAIGFLNYNIICKDLDKDVDDLLEKQLAG
jgi:hypothetical protein